jgi:hypothetical protein
MVSGLSVLTVKRTHVVAEHADLLPEVEQVSRNQQPGDCEGGEEIAKIVVHLYPFRSA